MTMSSAERQPERIRPLPAILLPGTRPAVPHYLRPTRPVPVERSARVWWLAFGCWFAGSSLGQLLHSPAAVAFSYRYTGFESTAHGEVSYDRLDAWTLPGPLAVVVFGLVVLFLASLVLPMRDGSRWARGLLTVLAVPMELLLVVQVGRSLFTGPADGGGVAQGLLCLVALAAAPAAVGMMYRPSTRAHFQRTG
jgi:hypothetical protein